MPRLFSRTDARTASIRITPYVRPDIQVIYIVIDNEDKEAESYKRLYGDQVIMFDKQEAIDMTDSMELSKYRKCVVYARNIVNRIAKDKGCKSYVMLDDDYMAFYYKFDHNGIFKNTRIKTTMDGVFDAFVDFLFAADADVICCLQGGDFIGGRDNKMNAGAKKLSRKAMNVFVCRTDKPLTFSGIMNEDVQMYLRGNTIGKKIFSYNAICVNQVQTQANNGGLTDVYLHFGTYNKSFYSVMLSPSNTKISMMGQNHRRIHHRIDWNCTAPKILSERWRQPTKNHD